ncbi:MAG: dTDP-4-amino-4,6-dideoxygalactose transaminase [Bacteroidota bacterium]|jgi:dTDP-4-amino-4,6-dideoxygalactose transaminase
MDVKFNKNPNVQFFQQHLQELLTDYNSFRQKKASELCVSLLQSLFKERHLWLTHSGTAALEMVADFLLQSGKTEIIVPSFCFVSTAVAFQNKGFQLRFAEADPETLSASVPDILNNLINKNTAAVVWMHYAGTTSSAFMELVNYCRANEIFLIEDAALGFGRTFENQALGNFGDAAIFSFDITKPISAIQGGLLVVQNKDWVKQADTYYHIGTNRSAFEKGEVTNYQWVSLGSKCQMNELNAAFLLDDLQNYASKISRLQQLSQYYMQGLKELKLQHAFELPSVFEHPENHHVVGLLFTTAALAQHVQKQMQQSGIEVFSHYQALHAAPFAVQNQQQRTLPIAQKLSTNYLRLPLHEDLSFADIDFVIDMLQQAILNAS